MRSDDRDSRFHRPHAAGWHRVADDAGLVAMARLLRDYHQAVEGFRPTADAAWAGRTGPPAPGEVVCHGDFGPWNLVWDGTRPIGILDWDYAWPQPRIHDVAYALEYVAPFRDDADCLRWLHHPAIPDRRSRLERFAEAYGLTSTDGLVDAVLDQQELVLARVRTLAAEGREPQRTWQAEGAVEKVAERVEWSRRHRHLFEAAL
jgi:aminoglycoside phosphotransferase (APT) family kinase protein